MMLRGSFNDNYKESGNESFKENDLIIKRVNKEINELLGQQN